MSEEAIADAMRSWSINDRENPVVETVLLKCSDGVDLHVLAPLATQSRVIKNCIDDGGAIDGIRLHQVKSGTLSKIIEFWEQHLGEDDDPNRKHALEKWDRRFVRMNRHSLHEILMGAHSLDSPKLMDVLCRAMARLIQDMTVEEVRLYFNIEGDFTPEDEARIRLQNKWAFW